MEMGILYSLHTHCEVWGGTELFSKTYLNLVNQ